MTFLGMPTLVRQAGGFALAHWIAHERMKVDAHGHDDAHFVFITGGEFASRAAGIASPLIFNPAMTFHRDHFASHSGSFFTITVPSLDMPLPAAPVHVGNATYGVITRLMRECAEWHPDSDAVAESLCIELIAALGTRPERHPRWLPRALELLRAEPAQLRDVSRAIGVHPVHFTRTFREIYRCTPGEYVRAQKVRRAAELRGSKKVLAEIALEGGLCGSEPSHENLPAGVWRDAGGVSAPVSLNGAQHKASNHNRDAGEQDEPGDAPRAAVPRSLDSPDRT